MIGSASGSWSIWATSAPRAVSASAISRPTYPAPTITARAHRVLLKGSHEGECVAHTVQEVHAVAGVEPIKPVDWRRDRHRAGRDNQCVITDLLLGVTRGGDCDPVLVGVYLASQGVQP